MPWSEVKVAQLCRSLCDPMDYTVCRILQARILEWISIPFSRESFSTQGSNPGLLHWRQILYKQSHKGSPRILEWVAYPFSRGSFQLRNWTRVFCIAGRLFTSWATREAHTWVQMKTKSCWEHWVCCYHQLLILSLLLKHKHFHLCHYEIWIKESVCVFSDYFTCDWV